MSAMDWRLVPENRAIAERFDAVSSSFPFYSNFLDVFKKVEEKIQARNERRLRNTREDENEACSDSEEEAGVGTSERQYGNENKDQQRDAADNTEKWKNAGNHDINHSPLTFGDSEDAIRPVNSFINGNSTETTESEFSSFPTKKKKVKPQREEQFRIALHSDDQSNLNLYPAELTGNLDGQHISRKETANHRQDENNSASSKKRDEDNILLSDRNTRSPSSTELGGNDIVPTSSLNWSECDVIESGSRETSHPDESAVGNEIYSDGVHTRNSSESEGVTAEGHDLYEDDDEDEGGESDPGVEGFESRIQAEDINDDNDDEDITESDDESSDSEKLLWLHMSNLRTMVNLVPGKDIERARSWNTKVLRRHPTNFIALRNKVNLYMMLSLSVDDSTFVSSALETLECLEGVANDRREMLMAKAEVAAIHDIIANSVDNLLKHSVPLYEEVLQEIDDLLPLVVTLSDSVFRDLVALWKRNLVDAYVELLMGATKTVLERHGHTQSTLFSRIKDILQSIVSDEEVSKHIRAKAYIKLGDSFIYYLGNTDKEDINRQLYEDINIDDCFRQARLIDPDDPDILLRTARQQRLKAKMPDELKEVIEVLSCCVNKMRSEKGEQKDVALHHLGLAYRSLWLKTGLHTTPQLRVYFRSSALRDANGFSPPVGCLVIKPPKTQLEPVLVPRPYKNPPKHILMNSNPITRSTDDPNLLEARQCFLEADSLTSGGGGCLYPVEVARTYICSGDKKKVQEYLDRAHRRKTIAENGVYLYEQMGLFEESTLTDDWNATAYDLHLEKIKSIYREAIRYDTRGTRSAVVAFYRLLEILYGQIQTMDDDLVRQSEYFLLYMTIQQTERPEEMVKTMTDDDIKIGLMWRLVEMFHKRNGPHDAVAAFTYLSIITTAKKLTVDIKDICLTISEKLTLLLDSTVRVALERTVRARYIPQSYEWLCYLDEFGKEDRPAYNSSFGILVDTKRSAELKVVSGILRKQLCLTSIEVIRGSGLQDVQTKESLERVLDTLGKCVSIVVITKKDSIQTQRILSVVEAFCSASSCNQRRICQAVCADAEESELISGVPAWYLDKEIVSSSSENKEKEVDQACRLLRALFVRHE